MPAMHRPRSFPHRLARAALVVTGGLCALAIAAVAAYHLLQPRRTTAIHDPPVLAGRPVWAFCAGGFYARLDDTLVLTSSGHCAPEGAVAYEPDGRTIRGVFGPAARTHDCPHPDHVCKPSDMNYLVVPPDRIPWGHLNVVDLGAGGYRVLDAGERALACDDIPLGARVEINGRDIYRTGTVLEKGEYLHDPARDGDYFACLVVADIAVAPGDSGGAVLVDGRPAGVTSRSFGGILGIGGLIGFTPLAEGLEALGLELCTTPDCGLQAP
jgi:hypothetical protein